MSNKIEFAPPLWGKTSISSDLDFTSPGKRFGDLRLKYSDNQNPLGHIPIPAGIVINGSGPTVLLTGGVHGDEFEGPVALLKFLHQVAIEKVKGRIIVFPALNAPAVQSSSRVSPLDNGNLNRVFPGDSKGAPTAMIAHFVEEAVMPVCDAVIDLHSGGKAAWFSPCSMAVQNEDPVLSKANLELATVFGSRFLWLMGTLNDTRTVNHAAVRQNLPMISAELGGGGQVTPETLQVGELGILNCLRHLNVLEGKPASRKEPPIYLEITDPAQQICAPRRGLYEPVFSPGDRVSEGRIVGFIYDLDEIGRTPAEIRFPIDGVAYVRGHRGLVERGELLAIVGSQTQTVTK